MMVLYTLHECDHVLKSEVNVQSVLLFRQATYSGAL